MKTGSIPVPTSNFDPFGPRPSKLKRRRPWLTYDFDAMILAATTRLAEALLRGRAAVGAAGPLRERLMLDARPDRADIWIHAASVGELNSASVLIKALARSHKLLVTTNSATGLQRARARGWTAALAPLDVPRATERFLDAVRPSVAVTVEAELWPTRARLLAEKRIPHVIVGARMSERSARRWSRLPRLIAPVLRNVAALSAQDEDSQHRLLSLGLPQKALLPRLDLKLLAPAQTKAPKTSAARDRTFLAASTHPGEEEHVLDAWLAARANHPDCRLIIAPRHPERGDQLAALMTARGLDFGRRSKGVDDHSLLLGDSLGEMPLWYDRAGICLTGGSLVDHGGHTPWEPAAHACAILHGPFLSNFAQTYAALDQAQAAQAVDTANLSETLNKLLSRPQIAHDMGRAARNLLDAEAGDPAPLLKLIANLVKDGATSDIKGTD